MTRISKATIIYSTAFTMALTINAVNLALVFYSKEKFQATPAQVGIMNACYNISYLVACLGLRRVVSRLATRWSMVLATGSFLLGVLFMYGGKTIGPAYFGQCVSGAGTAFFWPPLMGWLSAGLEGQALSRATGIYNLSWSVGCIISPMLTGYLSSRDASYPLLMGIMSYLSAFVFFVWHRNHPMLLQADRGGGSRHPDSPAGARPATASCCAIRLGSGSPAPGSESASFSSSIHWRPKTSSDWTGSRSACCCCCGRWP